MNCKTTNKTMVADDRKSEGTILLENKMYADIGRDGVPINEVNGAGSIFTSVHREIYFRGDYMIDINENIIADSNKFIRKDTIGYTFYHFPSQQYITYKSLSANAAATGKGFMADPGGSFSNSAALDPMNGIEDSLWHVRDTVINGDSVGIISFLRTDGADSLQMKLQSSIKFWINYSIKDFPLQLSYTLSKKLRGGFVYKMQLPAGDGNLVMVTSLHYQPARLPDSLVNIFDTWARAVAK